VSSSYDGHPAPPRNDTLIDRLTLWVLRSFAAAMLFFGVSLLMAGVPVVGMLAGSELAMAIARIFLQIAIVFIVAGAAGMYLSRSRRPMLPNEHPSTLEGARPTLGGWLIALAVALIALPVWLVVRLQSFLAEWGRVVDYLATWDIWSGGDANGSGLVLVPLAGALTPPMFELAAAVSMVGASVMLIALLLLRSQRFPRVYLVCLILLAAPVIASARGASAAALAGSAVQQLIVDTSVSADESAQLSEGLQRYASIVGSTAPVLAWTFGGYLIWMPALLFSRRARSTFATSGERRVLDPARAADLEAVTSPPPFPG
jgi:hypothetical protein